MLFFMSPLHQHVSPLLHVSSTSTCVPSSSCLFYINMCPLFFMSIQEDPHRSTLGWGVLSWDSTTCPLRLWLTNIAHMWDHWDFILSIHLESCLWWVLLHRRDAPSISSPGSRSPVFQPFGREDTEGLSKLPWWKQASWSHWEWTESQRAKSNDSSGLKVSWKLLKTDDCCRSLPWDALLLGLCHYGKNHNHDYLG